MVEEIILQESTRQLLEEPLFGEQDIDTKIRALLEAEYLRRLQQYHRQDRHLTLKYGMSFAEFVAQRIVAQHGYTWEVEQDAMTWETAIVGMTMIAHKQ